MVDSYDGTPRLGEVAGSNLGTGFFPVSTGCWIGGKAPSVTKEVVRPAGHRQRAVAELAARDVRLLSGGELLYI